MSEPVGAPDVHVRVSIAILTYNGDQYLRELLFAVRSQVTSFSYEVVCVDSGSTDGTLSILEKFPEVLVHQIPNEEFGHGRTRNFAASVSHGEIMVYLTQDAVPGDEHWLDHLIKPFDLSDRIACVYGRQSPRWDCCPAIKQDVLGHFRSLGPAESVVLQSKEFCEGHKLHVDGLAFFSNVNSAVRRCLLCGDFPFPDVTFAEDQALALKLLDAGYIKAYAASARVMHSHSLKPIEYLQRMFDEFTGLRNATGQVIKIRLGVFLRSVFLGTISQWRFIAKDPSYSRRVALRWAIQSPIYNVFRFTAIWLANHQSVAKRYSRTLSREVRLRKQMDP